MPASRDLTGTTLGDFRVERQLGRGGMGEVYLATQISLNRSVALKVLRPDMLANPTYLSRFEAEAWAAAKLNHPNIVHIYSLGSIDDVRFIAMEYVQGTNLREYIERKGPPEVPLALAIMRQAGQAIGAAGEIGLIHRDIKPENLLLTRKGQIKVADFGLCRDKEGQRLHLTQPGVTMGTPMYMSPEQVQGLALDHRTDLYSMGVTFYHLLAGVPPFRAETALALALKHLRDEPASLAVHRPDLPADLIALVMKLMAKEPARRYGSAAEMLRDLARVKEALHAAATGPVSLPETAIPPAPSRAKIPVSTEAAPVVSRPPLGERLAGLKIGVKTSATVVALSLVVGVLGGWMGRADDLLGPNAPEPKGPPALWMAPWDKVPKQPDAAAQYRYALVRAADADQEAAWLAVPGRFPGQIRWTTNAYVQLARYLFRHHDTARLAVLAAELARSDRHHEEKQIARAVRAASLALDGDVDGVLDALDAPERKSNQGPPSLDAGLAELCLEVVLHTRDVPGAGQHATNLTKLVKDYRQALRLDLLDNAGTSPSN
jgi:hypothetical protein